MFWICLGVKAKPSELFHTVKSCQDQFCPGRLWDCFYGADLKESLVLATGSQVAAYYSENSSSVMYRIIWMFSALDTRQTGSYSGHILLGGISPVTCLRNPTVLPNIVRWHWHWISLTTNQSWAKQVGTPVPSLTFHFYRHHQLVDVDISFLMFLHFAGGDIALYNF